MSYEIIPRGYRDLINNNYPQINDDHKNQLTELWRIMLQFCNNNEAQTGPQFNAFLQMEFSNENDPQTISDTIDAEIEEIEELIAERGGRRKRKGKSSMKRKGKSSMKRKGKSSKKSSKKSYKKRK
jgi:hypothetical protein